MLKESIITPHTTNEMGLAFLRVVRTLKRQSLRLLLAHWAGETGWGKGMHNENPGNKKSSGKAGDWTFFGCDENLTLARAEKLKAGALGNLVSIRKTWVDSGGVQWANVWFDAPHPYSRFESFDSLDAGVSDYVSMMKRRFPKSWQVVLAGGTPEAFSSTLRSEGYYTASVTAYTRLMKGVLAMVDSRGAEALAMVERVKTESVPLS
jgi:hypothetical protein